MRALACRTIESTYRVNTLEWRRRWLGVQKCRRWTRRLQAGMRVLLVRLEPQCRANCRLTGQWSVVSGLAYLFYFRLRVPETFYLPRHSSSLRAIPLPSSSTDNRPFHSGSSPRKVHSDPVCAQGDGPTSSDTRCQAGFQAIERLAQQAVRPRVVNLVPARSRAEGQ